MPQKVLVYLANGIGNCLLVVPSLKALKLLGYDVDLAIPVLEWPRASVLPGLFRNQPFISNILSSSHRINIESYDSFLKCHVR